ncbi:MAG: hypothetical protein COX65_05655 [Elusimicrobia bacterium CG_4_10_14_0_2_um_filter_56_8]|nr:MAG: hypothetical protein COX65_05655 [Elusimicrobia bacterium CG_4_10_14_0_2_um_filter_56_8]
MNSVNKKLSRFSVSRFPRTVLLLALVPLLSALTPANAAIAQSINYQGFLLSKLTNFPVETPQDIKFVIHGAATGSSALFTESRCNVAVNKGRYDVEIGSASGGIPDSVFLNNQSLWLEIQVDSDGDCSGTYEAMTPRIRMQASPYAFNSLYASTASAATSLFSADIIGALPQTTNGAITISTNLFVQGGISVGSISPGQKLAVAGIVESSTGGFKFPDGSIQLKAAAITMWDVSGPNVYSINPGNIGIGEDLTSPLARLHISSAAGDAGDLLLVSTGTSQLFLVNGMGQVYGGSFYGDGTTLTGIVSETGDTMTGQLTLAGSSLTVTSQAGVLAPKFKMRDNVEISSAPASVYGGIMVSTHVYLSGTAKYYGDGSGLINVVSLDTTKVMKAGDTMTGQLTLSGSSLTVKGSAFSVAGATFSVLNGNTAVGTPSYLARLTVGGGMIVTSSITAQGGLYGPSVNSPSGVGTFYNVTAATGTFWSWDVGTGYSVDTSSGIKVRAGIVDAPYFVGNGSLLTNVSGTDASRVLKAGDTMTGNMVVSGSSLTIASYGTQQYALTVASAAAVNAYSLAVTTSGYIGVGLSNPAAPLEVNKQLLVSNSGGDAHLDLNSNSGYNYILWSDASLGGAPPVQQGVLGFIPNLASRDLVYRAGGTSPGTGGQEVFRIKADSAGIWKFGIGTNNPTQSFHIASNMLVSTASVSPILFISTAAGRVSISTTTQTHALTVGGGISAVSSITAQGGFYGNGAGITNISAGNLPGQIVVATITALSGQIHDGVVFSTTIYAASRLSVGTDQLNAPFDPLAALHVRGATRLDQKADEDVVLELYPNFSGDAYIKWYDGTSFLGGVLGMDSLERDLVYRAGGTSFSDGIETFRARLDGKFIVGSAGTFNPAERFHVLTNMAVSAAGSTAVLFVSTGSGSVGISTGTPKERMHVASSFLVGADRSGAVLYVSTQSLYTGIGTGSPQAKLDVNGLGIFRSSLTVTGAGLTGTQSALEVIGSTLVVRNDGKVGVGTSSPQARLDVNGSAQFGSGLNRSTFTAEGFWLPRAMTTAEMQAASPPVVGAVLLNSSIKDLCVSTGTAVGQWALAGSKGVADCF